jgi:hypothetical protein
VSFKKFLTSAFEGFLHAANIHFGGGSLFKNWWTNSNPIPLFEPVINTEVTAMVIIQPMPDLTMRTSKLAESWLFALAQTALDKARYTSF